MTRHPRRAKAILVQPVRPSAAVEAAYRRKLLDMIDAMHKTVMFHIKADWKKSGLAMDLDPRAQMDAAVRKMAKQWMDNFKSQSKSIADGFSNGTLSHHDRAFKASMRKAGFTVRPQIDKAIRRELDDRVDENIGLISSIPEEYMDGLKMRIMDSIEKGRSMTELMDHLEGLHGMTKRRAAIIARDQNNKATAIIHRVRQKQVGINKAKWVHTAASIHPREEHIMFDGQTYNVDEGMYSEVDGEFVWPGTPINCGCTCMSIIPGDEEGEEL